jgi:hypothetical protein
MPHKQLNIRLPDNSLRQLLDLQSKLGMTQVQVIMLALDRLATQENNEQAKARKK